MNLPMMTDLDVMITFSSSLFFLLVYGCGMFIVLKHIEAYSIIMEPI